MTTIRVRCVIPHCRNRVTVPDGLTREGICDRHWVVAPQRMRDAYLRADPKAATVVYQAWAKIRRTISQRVTIPK